MAKVKKDRKRDEEKKDEEKRTEDATPVERGTSTLPSLDSESKPEPEPEPKNEDLDPPVPAPKRRPVPEKKPVAETPENVPVKPAVRLQVFLQVAGPKWDQMAGFASYARKEKMGPMSISEWRLAFQKFMNKPTR